MTKITFISARPFGLQGTPGTYNLVDCASELTSIQLVSAPASNTSVFTPKNPYDIIYLENIHKPCQIKNAIPLIQKFDPDIIYIFNFPGWVYSAEILRSFFRKKSFILDIKTPLLIDGEKRKKIQETGCIGSQYLDCILTLSTHSAKTWIPETKRPIVEYPLGLDLAQISPFTSIRSKSKFRNFVYIGSLAKKRQLLKFVNYFINLSNELADSISLDIYGIGDGLIEIENLIAETGSTVIKLQGQKKQDELFSLLQNYDAGIAWVPKDMYNESPSLKILEFMAIGLPVLATETKAHRSLLDDGFSAITFQESFDSFKDAFILLNKQGISKKDLKNNISLTNQLDYREILKNFIFPAFQSLT